ncbi:unnamed protein product [Ceratitis capitata]|uniref:(Mediterranean fruit fly) hypothetical protein n=1 Tax=Ceratitis capitata TaxID=7213 RepID=A0A811U1E3_CERCA|nr:unnamed protein product [Ceratitis capitata]
MYNNLFIFFFLPAKMQRCGFVHLLATMGWTWYIFIDTYMYVCVCKNERARQSCMQNIQIKYKNYFPPATTTTNIKIDISMQILIFPKIFFDSMRVQLRLCRLYSS